MTPCRVCIAVEELELFARERVSIFLNKVHNIEAFFF